MKKIEKKKKKKKSIQKTSNKYNSTFHRSQNERGFWVVGNEVTKLAEHICTNIHHGRVCRWFQQGLDQLPLESDLLINFFYQKIPSNLKNSLGCVILHVLAVDNDLDNPIPHLKKEVD